MSDEYVGWVSSLKIMRRLKDVGRRMLQGFAAVLGDKAVLWTTRAALEHLPEFASDQSLALIASAEQLDTYPGEPWADIAARLPYAKKIDRFFGSKLGLLLGLHFAGFKHAVLVQQNGRAWQLTLPLPDFGGDWDPTPNLVKSALGGNPQLAGHAWWTFDNDNDFCSRFAVLFPDSAGPFTTTGRATFASTDTAPVAWNNPLEDATYRVVVGAPVVTSGAGPAGVGYDASSKTTAGMIGTASGPWSGYVDYWAYPAAASNPFVWLRAGDLARLQATIQKWRPGKATCKGVYVFLQGAAFGWPVRKFGIGEKFQPGQTIVFQGA